MRQIMICLFVLMFTSMVIAQPVQARGWLDDFYDAAIPTNSSSYISQTRSYHSLGGLSLRTNHKAESVVSITPPSIKIGCGGIDAFWGGLDFLNADYLVKKVTGALKAMPYVLVQMGIKALSASMGGAIESAEAIIDELNQIQLDECGMAKGGVQFVSDLVQHPTAPSQWQVVQKVSDIAQRMTSGISASAFDKVKNASLSNPLEHLANTNLTLSAASIGDEKRKALLSVFLTGNGQLLSLLSDSNFMGDNGISPDEANRLRALVGDISFSHTSNGSGTALDRKIIKGCLAEKNLTYYVYQNGILQMGTNNQCSPTDKSIAVDTKDKLILIANHLIDPSKRKTNYDAKTQSFINLMSVPVLTLLSSSVSLGGDAVDDTASLLLPILSNTVAYTSIQNLFNATFALINVVENDIMAVGKAEDIAPIISMFDTFKTTMSRKLAQLYSDYTTSQKDLGNILQLTQSNIEQVRNMNNVNKVVFFEIPEN